MVGPEFEIHEAGRRGWARISIDGELDMATALTFRRRMRDLRAAHTNVSLDLSQLEFIDCAGACAVIDAVAQSRQSAWCVQVEPNMAEQARRLFDRMEATGLPRVS